MLSEAEVSHHVIATSSEESTGEIPTIPHFLISSMTRHINNNQNVISSILAVCIVQLIILMTVSQ